ncbi:hypothetical protein UPYG_G00114130 [Umbra pygmaea]|uniref:Uncharacterized protein n=1 Tax=Umbra pygmaea TaxID=75934 RepID=A0ABD0XQY2_UMBPY
MTRRTQILLFAGLRHSNPKVVPLEEDGQIWTADDFNWSFEEIPSDFHFRNLSPSVTRNVPVAECGCSPV